MKAHLEHTRISPVYAILGLDILYGGHHETENILELIRIFIVVIR